MTRTDVVRRLIFGGLLLVLFSWASEDSKSVEGILIVFLAYLLGNLEEFVRQEMCR